MQQQDAINVDAEDFSVVAVGKTENCSFPLILVFGRENNGAATLNPGISLYDPDISSGSAFWNRAFGFLQRSAQMSEPLRRLCLARDVAPVLFSNALPTPIPNQFAAKGAIRTAIPNSTIKKHIEGVFGLSVIKRVVAVVFSTGPEKCFEFPREMVQANCFLRGIKFIEAPYFASRMRNEELDTQISLSDRALLREVVDQFRSQTSQLSDSRT